jgi:signal transduction histidine kinase
MKTIPCKIISFRVLCLLLPLLASTATATDNTNSLEILSVNVNGNPVPIHNQGSVSLGTQPQNVVFGFGPATNTVKGPLRLRYRLEGYENVWHEGGAEMDLTVRFYNNSGDQISQRSYPVHGESTGWTGSLKTSALTHRRETLVVPPQAARLLVVISSAGPPDSVGIYVVANLVVSKTDGNTANAVLLQSPFDSDQSSHLNDDSLVDWTRDGIRPSMAKIVKFGQDPQTKAFAIVDEDPATHAEWHNIFESAPRVMPGDHLVVEWNEMYSIASGTIRQAGYGSLAAGKYKFEVHGVDVMGKPTGAVASVAVFVPNPFWKTTWFWGVAVIVFTISLIGVGRYFVWQRMRREMVRLKQQRALEQERLRIAHDIHDDLGARVTQISLLSAMSQENTTFPEKARADFGKVSQMSRELVSALYETVWAVNPENDHLEALGNYLCQMVNQLCERTPLRCRFSVPSLPHEMQISSQTRHNISMAVKEAVHNVIKHAHATEVAIRLAFADGFLNIWVEDNGAGFQPVATSGGHGLSNMKKRLTNIGGHCFIESQPGKGTTVRMRLSIKPLAHAE